MQQMDEKLWNIQRTITALSVEILEFQSHPEHNQTGDLDTIVAMLHLQILDLKKFIVKRAAHQLIAAVMSQRRNKKASVIL